MEGVSTVMPLALGAGKALASALPLMTPGGDGPDTAAEARAQAAEAQARRQAEAVARQARDKADELREQGQKARAKARVGAATSGLTLSGTSLLSLENLDAQTEGAVDELLGEARLRMDDILAGGAEQARSIRLSGRTARSRQGGANSLLRLGGQFPDWTDGGRSPSPTTPPTFPALD